MMKVFTSPNLYNSLAMDERLNINESPDWIPCKTSSVTTKNWVYQTYFFESKSLTTMLMKEVPAVQVLSVPAFMRTTLHVS